jgi:hypothetical protein
MKVKIGEEIYDSELEPIMIILDDEEKKQISNMLPECYKYCSAPDIIREEIIRDFMKIE